MLRSRRPIAPRAALRGKVAVRRRQTIVDVKQMFTLLDLCVSSFRRGHANLLCIVPILMDDPRRDRAFPAAEEAAIIVTIIVTQQLQ